MKILVTGAAGFIGAAVSQYLINRGDQVVGIDNINDYYDVNLKHARLDEIKSSTAADLFSFIEMGVSATKWLRFLKSTNLIEWCIWLLKLVCVIHLKILTLTSTQILLAL